MQIAENEGLFLFGRVLTDVENKDERARWLRRIIDWDSLTRSKALLRRFLYKIDFFPIRVC